MKKTERKIFIMGREERFTGLVMLKGRVIYPVIVTLFGMKELMEKLKIHEWMHLFLCPLVVIYGEAMLHFYKNFRVLEDGRMNSEVRRVDLVLDVKLLGKY